MYTLLGCDHIKSSANMALVIIVRVIVTLQ